MILVWRKSSRSGSGGNECVEVAIGPTAVLIRDSKNPDDGVLHVTRRSWRDFLRGVKAGQFDRTSSR